MGEQIRIKQKKLEIQLGIFIYLIYILYFWICDVFDLICFISGIDQGTVISRVISGIILAIIIFFIRGNIKLVRVKKDVFFYFLSTFIVVFGLYKSICPDMSVDVLNYHLLAQEPGFVDSFVENVAPGDFQMMGFLLPDRLYLPFRLILGYRAGTLLSTVIMLLIYSQVTQMLVALCKRQRELIVSNCKGIVGKILSLVCRESILAFFAVFCFEVVIQTATYMVELAAIPLALGALWLLIKNNIDKKEILLFALLNGIFFAMKLTNIVYIVPMVLIFIIKNFKKINPRIWVGCILLCAAPVSIYIIFNFSTTGNPVFPYYNSIFNSGYFELNNFKDYRWGAETLIEVLLWPFYMISAPSYRHSEVVNNWPYALIVGIIFVVIFIIRTLRRKSNKPVLSDMKFVLSLVLLISFYLWAFTTGHNRYFMFGFIISGIMGAMILFFLVSYYITHENKRLFSVITSMVVALIMLVQSVYSFSMAFKGYEWSWRENNTAFYNANFQYWLRDQKVITNENIPNIDMFLFAKNCNGSIAHQINPDAKIVLYPYIFGRISDESETDRYIHMVEEYLLDNSKTVADLVLYEDLQETIEKANEYNLKIKDIYTLDSAFVLRDTMIIIEYEKNLQETDNTVINLPEDEYQFRLNTSQKSEVTLFALLGFSDYREWFIDGQWYISVEANIDGENKILYKQAIQEGEFVKIDTQLDLSEIIGDVTINLKLKNDQLNDANIDDLGPYRLLIINPKIN